MSFRRAVASNVAVQAIGPASAFLTVFVIARLGGPADQGQFAQLKALVDLMVALGCFGFPQGFVYVVNKLGASASALARWSRLYAAAFVPVALLAAVGAQRLGYLGGGGAAGLGSVAVVTVAAALLVLHGLWRGLYLTHSTGGSFAVFTILPAVALLALVLAAMLAGWPRFDWLILLSTLPTVLVAAVMMRPVLGGGGPAGYRGQPWGPLLTNGLHSFVQAMLMTLQPLAAYGLVRLHGGDTRDVGLLNVGLFLVQALTVPITMVSPLLFARWTSVADHGLIERLRAVTGRALGLGAAAGVVLALATVVVVPLVFGADYGGAVRPAQAMLLVLPLVCHARVVSPALHARGRPGINTTAYALRLGVFALGALLLPRAVPHLLVAIAAAWAASEIVSAAWVLLGLRYTSESVAPVSPVECP